MSIKLRIKSHVNRQMQNAGNKLGQGGGAIFTAVYIFPFLNQYIV
jgi:hypothetical protein